MGYTSHQAGTCGLHIHVNRDAFGNTEGLQDVRIARILYFFEKNWEELLKFSRRTQSQLNQWAARYGYKDQPREILDHAKKGGEGGRYSCVNLQNRDTIEFRIFRGAGLDNLRRRLPRPGAGPVSEGAAAVRERAGRGGG